MPDYDWLPPPAFTEREGHAACVVLSVLSEVLSEVTGEDAIVPSSFEHHLTQLALHCDDRNLGVLVNAFGPVADAVWIYKNKPGGLEILRQRSQLWRGGSWVF